MTGPALLLAGTAAAVGVVHALLGPDHYVPFVVLARAREWSRVRTIAVTAACGIGHVLGSLVLGAIAVGLGWSLSGVEAIEGIRGDLAGWMLVGFGVAYAAWGLRRAVRSHRHEHLHVHEDGEVHQHEHDHTSSHAHIHESEAFSLTPWVLFTIFVFGPCEPLVPLMMAPALTGSPVGLLLVIATFGLATIGTMVGLVLFLMAASTRVELGSLARFQHALAGAALAGCGLAIQLGL